MIPVLITTGLYARDPKFYGATFCIGCNPDGGGESGAGARNHAAA